MNVKDARDALGLGPTGSMVEIKKSYQRLAMIHHPDRKTGDAEKFKAINEAYSVLNNIFNNTCCDGSPLVMLPISILEAFTGCIKTVIVDGIEVDVIIPEGTLSNDRIDTSANATVVVTIHSEYTIDIGSYGNSTQGNVTKTVLVSPFLMMTGGFLDVDMLDGGTAKVRIPAGLQANSLLKVAKRGFFKGYECEDRGDCLLRIVPEIKKLENYTIEELENLQKCIIQSFDVMKRRLR